MCKKFDTKNGKQECRFCPREAEFIYKFQEDDIPLCGPCSNGVDHGMDLAPDFIEAVCLIEMVEYDESDKLEDVDLYGLTFEEEDGE